MNGWNFFREMDALWREVDDIFRVNHLPLQLESSDWSGSFPRVALKEMDDKVLVEALIPGIDTKSLDISVMRNTLSIVGERQLEQPENVSWHRRERSGGRFMRTLDLPADIDADKVAADYAHGVLKITLPKAESAKPKRIEIKS
ncbi:MAG: molecular chaperone Hsp20 [Desulfuromonas sp.]|nr:MAG: molecular chaperone Hsp20 [Desulfuromonas sp.]